MPTDHTRTVVLENRHEGSSLSARLPVLPSSLAAPEHVDTAAFNFMKELAQDLYTNRLCLPSLPEVVIRIRRALVDEHSQIERVVRVVGAEPVLASRVMKAANSALAIAARPVSDLHAAVHRLGLQTVYGLAMSTALQQVLHAQVPDSLRSLLKAEWECAVRLAVISQSIARRQPSLNSDEAFLAGLFHNVGKLFIVKRAADFPALIESQDALQLVMDAWHNVVGFALTTHWGLANEVATAVRDYNSYDDALHPADLTAVLYVAHRFAGKVLASQSDDDALDVPVCRALDISLDGWRTVVSEAQEELEHLHYLLGV